MKRIIGIILAVYVMALLLSACGNVQNIKNEVSSAIDDVKNSVADVVEEITGAVSEIAEDVSEAISEVSGDVGEAVAQAKEDLAEAVSEIAEDVSEIAEGVTEQLKDTAEAFQPEDGSYMVNVTMEGGTGRVSILSPCTVEIKDGQATATIIWSSEKYDYMLVDGERYEPIRIEGGSTFEIPVAAFDEPLTVVGDTTAMSEPHEIEYTLVFDSTSLTANVQEDQPAEEPQEEELDADEAGAASALEDGVYSAVFETDSSMFHVNEAKEGRGILTVEDGVMTIHISLVSKSILNLFPGLAEDAQKDGAVLLEPTTDEVTYSDGYKEEVYGFDVPVPALDEEFDLALIGKKGVWYDHKVSVSDPQPLEEEADAEDTAE